MSETSRPAAESDAPTLPVELRLTPRHAAVVGMDRIDTLDATDDYHEASRLSEEMVDPPPAGARRIELNVSLREATARSATRHRNRPLIPLPTAEPLSAALTKTLTSRRSRRSGGRPELTLSELATLLHASCGITGRIPGTRQTLRTAPSAGALYPLELYLAAGGVRTLAPGLFRYDPFRHALERVRCVDWPDELAPLTPFPEAVVTSAATVVVCASFWRSRFKYGQRAYRFTLLEAGHAVQNLLLAATALELPNLPLGGFYDRRVDSFVGLDGVFQASLYLVPIWGREP